MNRNSFVARVLAQPMRADEVGLVGTYLVTLRMLGPAVRSYGDFRAGLDTCALGLGPRIEQARLAAHAEFLGRPVSPNP